MNEELIGALLLAIAMVIAAIITALASLKKKNNKIKKNKPSSNSTLPVNPETDLGNGSNSNPESIPESQTSSNLKQVNSEKDGILYLFRERIYKRATDQLDPAVRRYETWESIEEGCESLAKTIQQSGFTPDIILGWTNPETEYQGSQKVSGILAQELGVPNKLLIMQEIDERREVIDDCQWFRNIGRALLVDDACYSGSTLKSMQRKLSKINRDADIRFAVLSTQDPNKFPNLYFVSTHTTEELLFPWGWSRLIIGFLDVCKRLGISDRHTVWPEKAGWGIYHIIAKDFIGNIRLHTIEQNKEMQQGSNRDYDSFFYFIRGLVNIRIGDKVGSFGEKQYIFIPRLVDFTIKAESNEVLVLELYSNNK